MTAIFLLRVAVGLIAGLALLSPTLVNPRFYKAQFWITFGLSLGAAVFASDLAGPVLWIALGCALLLAFIGSVVWSLEGAPGGRLIVALTGIALAVCLGLAEWSQKDSGDLARRLAGDATSAALLGSALTAMLLGHFYLIAPGMSLKPLMRMLAALSLAVLLRLTVAAAGLWSWTAEHSLTNLNDVTILWLPLRWGVGFVAPLVLAWMAWQAARLRSTQSATGILYVAVIFCFLGELSGQLLWNTTGQLL
jgi:hypothetical protein